METVTVFIFLGSKITADGDCSHEIKDSCSLEEKLWQIADKCLSSQSYDFSSSHTWMWVLDHKEGWVLKNQFFQIRVLAKTLDSPLECMEIKPVNPKENQAWISIGMIDTEAPIL